MNGINKNRIAKFTADENRAELRCFDSSYVPMQSHVATFVADNDKAILYCSNLASDYARTLVVAPTQDRVARFVASDERAGLYCEPRSDNERKVKEAEE